MLQCAIKLISSSFILWSVFWFAFIQLFCIKLSFWIFVYILLTMYFNACSAGCVGLQPTESCWSYYTWHELRSVVHESSWLTNSRLEVELFTARLSSVVVNYSHCQLAFYTGFMLSCIGGAKMSWKCVLFMVEQLGSFGSDQPWSVQ